MVAVNNNSNPFALYGSYLNNVGSTSAATTDLLSQAAGYGNVSGFDANSYGAALTGGNLANPLTAMGSSYTERSLADLTGGATNRYLGNTSFGVPSYGDQARGFELGNLGNVLTSFGQVANSAGQLVNSVNNAANVYQGNANAATGMGAGGTAGGPFGWSGGPPSPEGRDLKDPNVAAQFQQEMMAYQMAMEMMKMYFESASKAQAAANSTANTIMQNWPR